MRLLKLFGLVVTLFSCALSIGDREHVGLAQSATEAGGQQVWFTPNMDGFPPQGELGITAFVPPADAYKLFEPEAPWPTARAGIQVFEFYVYLDVLAGSYKLPISQAIRALKEANIAIAVEGAKRGTQCSGARVAEIDLHSLSPIIQAGAQLSYLSLDSPFAKRIATGEANNCGYTVEQAAAQLLIYIKAIRKQYPDVKIGLSEPVPWYTVGSFPNQPGAHFGDLPQILDTALAVLKQGGETFDFFHADSPYDYDEALPGGKGWAKLNALQDFVHSRGLRFGLIYNSERGGNTSDELFFRETLAAKAKFAQAGGNPDDFILQSWYWYPRQWLPEDQSYTYTYLVKKFLTMQVPVLSLAVSAPAADGSRQVTGTLKDQEGKPITNAPIELSIKPLSGPGVYADYTISGTVPSGATQAIVGFRVNTECDCAGASDFTLKGVRYVEGRETANRVPNGDFAQGLQGWGLSGTATARLELGDDFRTVLHLTATPAQTAAIDSTSFPVTPGASYTLTFASRVAPLSAGSGYFAIFLLSPSGEVRRDMISLEPARVSVGKATTDAKGGFQFTLRNVPEGKLLLEATYPGDDVRYLQGWASVTVDNSK